MRVDTWEMEWTARHGGSKAKRDVSVLLRSSFSGLRCHRASCELPEFTETAEPEMAILQFPTADMCPPAVTVTEVERFASRWCERWQRRVVIVHDVKSLQIELFDGRDKARARDWSSCERALLESATDVVTHTPQMENRLRTMYRCNGAQFWHLSIFDYLCSPHLRRQGNSQAATTTIALVGNLHASPLAEELAARLPVDDRLRYDVYGTRVASSLWGRLDVAWRGDYTPEQLPAQLVASGAAWGLCWWSDSVLKSDYLHMVAPHKASCFLAAGIPLLVPVKSYLASFAESRGIGASIDTLADLNDVVSIASGDCVDRRHLMELSAQLRQGHFLGEVVRSMSQTRATA